MREEEMGKEEMGEKETHRGESFVIFFYNNNTCQIFSKHEDDPCLPKISPRED
jgi:hypothetical protein